MSISSFNNLSPLQVCSPSQLNSAHQVATNEKELIKPDERIFLSVVNSLKINLGIDQLIAETITKKIFLEQKKLTGKKSFTIPASNVLPYELKITAGLIICLKKRIGKGTYSDVYSTIVVPTIAHLLNHQVVSPSRPLSAALKRSRKRFSPKQQLLEQGIQKEGTLVSPRKLWQGFDYSWITFDDSEEGSYCSLNDLFDYDLTKCDFTQFKKPVAAMLSALIPYARSLMILHKSSMIHRDVKSANFLLKLQSSAVSQNAIAVSNSEVHSSLDTNEVTGAITDFDLLRSERLKRGETAGTPTYLDPSMFGSLENCIVNQKRREGIQTKEGDVFSLGLTIFKSILLKFVKSKCQATSFPITEALEQIESIRFDGPFTDEELREKGRNANYRCMYCVDNKENEFLIQYPELTVIREKLSFMFSSLSESLTPSEIQACHQLVELSCQMQEVDLSKRPGLETVYSELNSISEGLKNAQLKRDISKCDQDWDVPSSSITDDQLAKRRRIQSIERAIRPVIEPIIPTQIVLSQNDADVTRQTT